MSNDNDFTRPVHYSLQAIPQTVKGSTLADGKPVSQGGRKMKINIKTIPVGGFHSNCHKAEVVTENGNSGIYYCTICKQICTPEKAYRNDCPDPVNHLRSRHAHFMENGFTYCLIGTPIEIPYSENKITSGMLLGYKDRYCKMFFEMASHPMAYLNYRYIHVNPITVATVKEAEL